VLLSRDPEALLIARGGGEVIGSLIVGWDGWRGSFYRLAVHQSWRRKLGQRIKGRPDPQLDGDAEPGPGDVLTGERGVVGVGLQRDQPPALGQSPGQPDRAVGAQRPELQDRLRAHGARQQVEQLSLRR
jgi:hypothetical protein